jgi:hypothetical protein
MTDSILVEFVIIFIFFAIACRIILTKINNKSGKKTIIDKKDKNEIIDKKNIIDKKIKNKINHITKN